MAAAIFASLDLRLLAKDCRDLSTPPWFGAGPRMPSPTAWKKGPHLPPWLPQEIRSLKVRGQPAAPPVGAKRPNAGACIMTACAGEEGREAELWKGVERARLFLFM